MRLDEAMNNKGLVQSRSQAERLIKLGKVQVNKKIITKPGAQYVHGLIVIKDDEKYVSRAGFKLASAADKLKLDFKGKTMLDVGSSTGGFTDYALQHGAKRVIAVDVGTDQLHYTLLGDPRIELHEKTDIREFETTEELHIVVMDVSFISLREILPSVVKLCGPNTQIVAMVKPQFEAANSLKFKGVIKNDTLRRGVLKGFEDWAKKRFTVVAKADSEVSGKKGNTERFYLLKKQ